MVSSLWGNAPPPGRLTEDFFATVERAGFCFSVSGSALMQIVVVFIQTEQNRHKCVTASDKKCTNVPKISDGQTIFGAF